MRSLATKWLPFARHDLSVPTELLARIYHKTADTWVTLEPLAAEQPRTWLRRRATDSPFNATISPYANDEAPHLLVYLTFPKGPRFTERGGVVPVGAELEDEAPDDASLRVGITTPAEHAVRIAMAALDSTSDSPLGEQWRARIGDTYVALPTY
jgi:hypothetical protein